MALADFALNAPEPDVDELDADPDAVDEVADAEGEANVETSEEVKEKLLRWADPFNVPNIAEEIDESKRSEIAMRVTRETEIDENSRDTWMSKSKDAMKLAMQVADGKTNPWPGASNVIFPLLTEASNQFAARAYGAIVIGKNVVRGTVHGEDEGVPAVDPATNEPLAGPDGEPQWQVPPNTKQDRADKIGEHMSWQLLEEQKEWEEETDRLLHILPVVGCHFRKTYYDPVEGRNMSVGVTAEHCIINYWAKSLDTAPRITEKLRLYPYEIQEHRRSGYFVDQDYGNSTEMTDDDDAPVDFLEQHRRLDLDEDGYAEPYIVTVAVDSLKVARIVARYDADGVKFDRLGQRLVKIEPVQYYTKFDFLPNREGGIYGEGLGQLLLPINAAVNTVLNQLLDAGHLANTQGGFIGKGLSMHSGAIRFKPGEWKVVNTPGAAVRDAIVPLQFKEPSSVLFNLLGTLIEAGKQISSVKDVLTGELKAQTISPTVFLAVVEQGLKVFTATWKRIHRSLKQEYDKLYRLNSLYLEENASYQIGRQWRQIQREDYRKGSGIEPVSDPNMVADVQRIARSEFLMQFKDDPMFDGRELRRRGLEAAQIEKVDELLPDKSNEPDPALLAQIAELELRNVEVKAKAMNQLADMWKKLAEADEIIEAPFREWLRDQIAITQQQVEALNGGGSGPGGAGGNQQRQPGAVPGMAASSSVAGGAPLPGGPPGASSAGPPGPLGGG